MSILVFAKLHQLKGRFLIVNNNIAAGINNFFYRWLIWLNSECTKRPFLMDAIDKHKPLFKLLSGCVQLRHVPYPVDRLILSLIPNRPEILSSFWGKLIRNKNILRVIGVDDEVHIIFAFNSIFFQHLKYQPILQPNWFHPNCAYHLLGLKNKVVQTGHSRNIAAQR